MIGLDTETSSRTQTYDTLASEPAMLPLWLTEPEAEALLSLLLLAPQGSNGTEHSLLMKLGESIRAFQR